MNMISASRLFQNSSFNCFGTLLLIVFIYLFDYPDFLIICPRVSDNRGSTVQECQMSKISMKSETHKVVKYKICMKFDSKNYFETLSFY